MQWHRIRFESGSKRKDRYEKTGVWAFLEIFVFVICEGSNHAQIGRESLAFSRDNFGQAFKLENRDRGALFDILLPRRVNWLLTWFC